MNRCGSLFRPHGIGFKTPSSWAKAADVGAGRLYAMVGVWKVPYAEGIRDSLFHQCSLWRMFLNLANGIKRLAKKHFVLCTVPRV